MLYSSFGSDNRITLLTALPAASVREPGGRGAALIGLASLLTILFPFAKIAIFSSMRRPNPAHFGNPVEPVVDLPEIRTDVGLESFDDVIGVDHLGWVDAAEV